MFSDALSSISLRPPAAIPLPPLRISLRIHFYVSGADSETHYGFFWFLWANNERTSDDRSTLHLTSQGKCAHSRIGNVHSVRRTARKNNAISRIKKKDSSEQLI